jgi:hypothetical protein
MRLELDPDEIEALLEGLDCLKTKIAFTKGPSPAAKNAKILKVQALEQKLSGGESGKPGLTSP